MLNFFQYVISCLMLRLIFFVALTLSYKHAQTKEKIRPFECGFEPGGTTRLRFCIKFFLVGVIFLIFDVEICLILPLPYCQTYILLFLGVLMLGLSYEWYYGGLDWITYVNRSCTKCPRGPFSWDVAQPLGWARGKSYVFPSTNLR